MGPKPGKAAPAATNGSTKGKSSSPSKAKSSSEKSDNVTDDEKTESGTETLKSEGKSAKDKSKSKTATSTTSSTNSDSKAAVGAKGKNSKETPSPSKKSSSSPGKGGAGGKTKGTKDGAAKSDDKEVSSEAAAEKKEGEQTVSVEAKDVPVINDQEKAKTTTSETTAATTKAERPLNVNEGPTVITGKIFLQAAIDSDLRAIKTYILRGPLPADVINFQNNSLMTALMFAAQRKTDFESCEMLKALLATLKPKLKTAANTPEFADGMCNPQSGHKDVPAGKLDINMQNRDGYTALHFAARKGFAEALLVLLEADADYDIVSTGAEKVTAAELTTDKKCKDYLQNAVALKAERARLQAVAVQGMACYTSVLKGDLRGVVRVGEKQAPPETYSYRPTKQDHYMLRHAIDLGFFEIFKEMLDKQAEKDVWDSRGCTPLMRVCALKRAGSYPTTKFSREKEELRRKFLEELLNNGTCTNTMLERRDKDGNNALHIACENGYIEDIISLIDKGVDVDARQISEYPYRGTPGQRIKSGDTAFIMTARRRQGFFECLPTGTSTEGNYMEVLATLRFEGKANVNLRGYNGMTALMWAAHNEDLDLLEWLIDEGADINEQENFGQTALMQCMENLKFKSAKYLLEFDLEKHIEKREREAAEMAEILAREEEEREKRRKEKKKLLKLGSSVDAATLEALEKAGGGKDDKGKSKDKSPKRERGPPSKETLLKQRRERENAKLSGKMGKKVITRWPRMLGYYREQDPSKWAVVRVPGSEEDAPPRPPEECNPNIPTLNDATPLIVICRKCKVIPRAELTSMVAMLAQKGANMNSKSSDGMSAITWAVLNDDLELCKQLLALGADPTTTDQLKISLLDNCKSGAMRMTVKSAVDAFLLAQKEREANEMGSVASSTR